MQEEPSKLKAWTAEVDRLMRRHWCIDTADAGLSADELERYSCGDQTPTQFVEWFAEKLDLIQFETSWD